MPRIKMTRWGRVLLLFLQVYLVFLVGLVIFKFFREAW